MRFGHYKLTHQCSEWVHRKRRTWSLLLFLGIVMHTEFNYVACITAQQRRIRIRAALVFVFARLTRPLIGPKPPWKTPYIYGTADQRLTLPTIFTLTLLRIINLASSFRNTMASTKSTVTPFQVTVHPFPSPTRGSCAYERGRPGARNALVFIGGLTSGPHTTDLTALAKMLDGSPGLDYSLWEFRMRSSYGGFGYSSLANDVEDTAALVRYLRGIGKERVVLMGSSTGKIRPICV